MRLRATTAWAGFTMVLASAGCASTDRAPNTGSGAAGSSGGEQEPGMALEFVRGGTRLVAMGYASNEARMFSTFHDTQLDFDCEFVSAAGRDEQRCIPRSQVNVVYTDSDCSSEPAGWAWTPSGAMVPGAAVSRAPAQATTTCPGLPPAHREAYRVGEQLTEGTLGSPYLPLFERSESGCGAAQLPGKVTPATYRLIPLEEGELARGERASVDLEDGLHLLRLMSDDGAELNLGITGSDGTPCALQRDGECVPEPIARPAPANSGKFITALNADCTEPAFEAPYWDNCGEAKYGVQDDGVRPLRVHTLKKASPSFSWQLTLPITEPLTFSCLRFDDSAIAAPRAPERDVTGTLPAASRLRRGAGPLYVDWYSRAQSELLPVASFVNDAGQPCQIKTADDGSERCALVDELGEVVGELTGYPEVTWGRL